MFKRIGEKVNSYIRNGNSKSSPVSVLPVLKKHVPDDKFYFCIMAKSNNKEIKLDVLSTEDSKTGWWFQDIKYGSVSLISIATVDVILSDGFVNGSISVKYNETEYIANNLLDDRETHVLLEGIEFYDDLTKPRSFHDYYASYHREDIWIYHGTNGVEYTRSYDDYIRITHTLKDNAIEFYVGKERIAQISSQIFPWEPRYVGWVLDSYQSVIPFLTVRLVIDWFQY